MYSGFSIYSLERELSSLERRKLAVKDKISRARSTGGPKNINIDDQMKELKFPPIEKDKKAKAKKAAKEKKGEKEEDKLPPLTPGRQQEREPSYAKSPRGISIVEIHV